MLSPNFQKFNKPYDSSIRVPSGVGGLTDFY